MMPICIRIRLSTYFYASPDPDPTEKLGQVNKTTNVNVNSGTAEGLKHFLKLFSDPYQQAQDTDPDSAKRYRIQIHETTKNYVNMQSINVCDVGGGDCGISSKQP